MCRNRSLPPGTRPADSDPSRRTAWGATSHPSQSSAPKVCHFSKRLARSCVPSRMSRDTTGTILRFTLMKSGHSQHFRGSFRCGPLHGETTDIAAVTEGLVFSKTYRVDVVSSIPVAAAETAAPGGGYSLISGAVIDCHQPQGVPINYPWHSSIFSSLSLFRFLMRVLLACVSSLLDRAVVLLPPESPPPRVLLCWCRSTNTSGLPWERTRTCLTFCSRVVYGS